MGNQLSSQIAQLDYYLHDLYIYLPGLVYDSTLGKGRFLKTLMAVHDEGNVVVKVFIKRGDDSLKEQIEKLVEIRENFTLVEHPNVLAFQKWVESDKAGFLIRQYFRNNLYDRISTRPFLTMIEKKWIVFQLLKALNQAHFYGVYHGDIKCENVMVTSWNWIYLADFASYKPIFIPKDNPADFSFFFDTSGRRLCYLAPERFLDGKAPSDGELTPEMDIFSVGCVIAELFLEGTPIFNYAQILAFIKGEYDPESLLNRIPDTRIQEMVRHMIQKDPVKRFSAEKYLRDWHSTAFPPYFERLHSYIAGMMKMEPDEKINSAMKDFNMLLQLFTSNADIQETLVSDNPGGKEDVDRMLIPDQERILQQKKETSIVPQEIEEESKNQDPAFQLLMETENFIHKLETENEDSSAQRALDDGNNGNAKGFAKPIPTSPIINADTFSSTGAVHVQPTRTVALPGSEGLILVMNVICPFLHTVRYPSMKMTAIELFSLFAKYLDSEARLQRIVPYLISLLSEEHALIRATAIRVLASVLDKVESFSPSDSLVFPAYILPAISKFSTEEPAELAREAFAESLAQLAETARRFLETSQFYKQGSQIHHEDKDLISYQESYDAELTEIQDAFYEIVVDMLTKDESTAVKVTLLSDITRLCVFFGRQKTNDFLLPLIITFLNDRHDWALRCAFFNNIVGVSAFVGVDSLEHFILPCILKDVTDEEEFVIDKAVNSLASLCELGLFRKHKLFDIAQETAPILYHPNMWIRYGVIAIMAAIASQLKLADVHCFLLPILKPFLVVEIIEITEANLLEALRPPVSRFNFDRSLVIASDITVSISDESPRDSPFNGLRMSNPIVPPVSVLQDERVDPIDLAFLQRLKELGVDKEEEEKLYSMKHFIRSASRSIPSRGRAGLKKQDTVNNLPRSIAVHSVSLPNYSEKRSMNSRMRQSASVVQASPKASPVVPVQKNNDEWKYLRNNPQSPKARRNSMENKIKPLHVIADYAPNMSTSTSTAKNFVPSSFPMSLFPPPPPDLGNLAYPAVSGDSLKDWQPKGVLVAHLHEHKGSVNQLKVSQDNMFFASASDDGTVKIWDCQRLEKNVTNRSRLTYSSQGGKIKSAVICENSHSIAAGSDNGTIHVFKVEYTTKKDSTVNRYTGNSTVKNIDAQEGPIVGLDHFNLESSSLLVYGTNRGMIHAWDLRTKTEPWVLTNPVNFGLLSSFMIEPGRKWLVTGTHSGFFTCWDLRFNIPVKSWRHPSKSRIHLLKYYNSQKESSWIFSTAGNANETTVWDVESGSCVQMFRSTNREDPPAPSVKSSSEMKIVDYGIEELQRPTIINTLPSPNEPGIKAILNPPDCSYLITSGDDKRIRYWHLQNAVNSYTVCGGAKETNKPRYTCQVFDGLSVFQEQLIMDGNSNSSRMKGPTPPSVNHHESIQDIALMESPHKMLISGSRDGVIKVWK